MEQLLLLLGDSLWTVEGSFVVWILDSRSLVGALEGAHRVSFFAGDYDDSAASRHLEDIVAMVGDYHEFGQCWIPGMALYG